MNIFLITNQLVHMLSSNRILFCSCPLFSSDMSKAVVLPKAFSFHLISYISCLNMMVAELHKEKMHPTESCQK